MEHLFNDHEDCLNEHKNSHKLCNEMGNPIVNLMESQWKLRQQDDQNFPMEEKPCRANTSIKKERYPKKQDYESRKINHLSKVI